MIRRFIAIFGESAVGKKTFIRKILDNDSTARQALQIVGEVRAFGPSFEPLSQMKNSTTFFNFYQWQNRDGIDILADLRHERLTIIVLWRPLDDISRNTWIWDFSARPKIRNTYGLYNEHNNHYDFVKTHQHAIRNSLMFKWNSMIQTLANYEFNIMDGRDYSIINHVPVYSTSKEVEPE